MNERKRQNDFIINFKGLADGFHEFNYVFDNVFFEELGDDDFFDGNVKLDILLNKESTMLTFDFSFSGAIMVLCDRCLEMFAFPIEKKERLYVKFSDELNSASDEDEIVYLKLNDYQINLYDQIRESIFIALPMQKIHPVDEKGNSTCNPEMVAKIEALAIKEENIVDNIDSRWAKLKEIKL